MAITSLFEMVVDAPQAGGPPVIASFFVPGIPAPGGSKKGFYIPKLKRVIITDAAGQRNKNWRSVVSMVGRDSYRGDPVEEAMAVEVVFVMPRIKGHFRSNGELKPNAPTYHTVKPDGSKLFRSTEDALTGIIWRDDSLIVHQCVTKVYGAQCGAFVTVYRASEVVIPTRGTLRGGQ